MRRVLSRFTFGLVVLVLSCTADGGPVGVDEDLLLGAGAGTPPTVILLGTSGGIATFQATWTGVAPFSWDARPDNKANSPKQFASPYATTSTTFTMTQQAFAYDGQFKVWEMLAGGGFNLLGVATWTVPALTAAPDAMDDGYSVPMGGTLSKGAGTGALSNDNLGSPAATLTSFGGGSLGGAVTDNAPGASLPLAGGTLTVNADGGLSLANPTVPGSYTFLYRLTNIGGSDDATVTIDVLIAPMLQLVGTGGGQAMYQATWAGTAPFAWDVRPANPAHSPKSFNPNETNTSASFNMTQQAFSYPAAFKVWEKLAGGGFNLLGTIPFTVPADVPGVAPTATDDGPYDVDDGGTLNVAAGAGPPDGLLVNDALGSPAATLTSFGGGSLGGAVTDNAAGASVALAGGTLTVNADGSFDLVTPTVVGTYTFMYRITNTAGTSDATVTINVNAVDVAPTAADDGPYDVDDGATLNVGAGAGPPDGLLVNDALGNPAAPLTSFGGGSLGGAVTDNAAGASVALAGGTLTVNADGSFDLVTPTVVGTYTFMYRITNPSGTSDATVTINVNSTGVAPTATADGPYDVDESASLNVGAGAGPPDGLLVNDALGNPAATLTSFGGGSLGGAVTDNAAGASVALAGGTLTVNADGSFDLVTPTVVGTYTFMYRITNVSGTSDATVTVNVNAVVPPVTATDDNYTATGNIGIEVPDGSLDVLGNDLGTGLTVNQVMGSGTNVGVPTTTTGGGTVTLQANGSFTYDPPAGLEGADDFTYQMTDGVTTDDGTVNITISGMIWFIDNTATGTDAGSFTNPFQSLASFNTANAAGGGTDPKDGHTISLESGTYSEADGINLRNNQSLFGRGVQLDNFFTADPLSSTAYQSYAGTAGTKPSITYSSGNGIDLATDNTVRGLSISNALALGNGINGIGFGTATISDVDVTTSGPGLFLLNGTAAMTFDELSTSISSGSTGITLSGVGGSLSENGTGSLQSAGKAVSITSSSLSFTYNGSIIAGGAGGGILLQNNSGTMNFGGQMTLNSSGLPAFHAFGGGTINATASGSTLNTTGTSTLIVNGTTIGGSGLTFQSISSDGGGKGIELNNAGSGGLTVTGTGSTNGSGGTIQNKTGRGVEVINTDGISLRNVALTNASTTNGGTCTGLDNSGCNAAIHLSSVVGATFTNVDITGTTAQQGINGLNVTGFTLGVGSMISGAGDNVNEGGVRLFNLDGTVMVDGVIINGSSERNFFVTNNFGSMKTLTMTVQNSNLDNTGATFGADGLEVELLNNTTMDLDVIGSVFSGNRTNGIQVIAAGNSVANSVDITANLIDPGTGVGKAIDLNTNNTGTMNFNVTGNPRLWSENGNVVNVSAFVNSSISGRVNSNPDIKLAVNTGTGGGSGVAVFAEEQADIVIEVNGNTISNVYADAGVFADAKAGTGVTAGRLDATISGNNVTLAATGFGFGLVTRAINDNTACVNVTNNFVNDLTGFAIIWEARASNTGSTLVLPGLTTTAGALWDANGNTPTTAAGSFINQSGSGTFTSGTCATPTHP